MKILFSATNHPPQDPSLGAVYDRFLLRHRIYNVPAKREKLTELVRFGWSETHATNLSGDGSHDFTGLLARLEELRSDMRSMTKSGDLRINEDDVVFARLTDLVTELRRHDLSQMSNRRLVKFTGIILFLRLLRAASAGDDAPRIVSRDLDAVLRFGLDREDPGTTAKLEDHLQDD